MSCLNSVSNTITESADYTHLLSQVVELENDTASSSKDLWLKMAGSLEVSGFEKNKIWSKVASDIEDSLWVKHNKETPREKFNWNRSGYFYRVGAETDYTKQEIVSTPLGEKEIVPPSEYETENYEYLKLINDTINFLKDVVAAKLKTNHFMSQITSKDAKLALHDWKAQLSIAEGFFDHKEKVPINTQHILLHQIATAATNNEAAHEYFRIREETHTLTSKQLSKYRDGKTKNRLAIFTPMDRITAILWSYLGIQCKNEECKSWRVVELPGTGIIFRAGCLDCESQQKVVQPIKCNECSVIFFEDDIAKLTDKTKCPYCEEDFSSIVIDKIQTL